MKVQRKKTKKKVRVKNYLLYYSGKEILSVGIFVEKL